MIKGSVSVAAAAVLLVALVGCSAPEEKTTEEPVSTPEPVVTETSEPIAQTLSFTLPATCAEALPASRISSFEAAGLVLLGGPGGRYAQYLSEPSPEEAAGGISCVWGFSDSEISSVTVSVAPMPLGSHVKTIEAFYADGLNEGEIEGASTFGVQGDAELQPAVYNVLRTESWISVISTVGGPGPYEDAVAIAAEAASVVYR